MWEYADFQIGLKTDSHHQKVLEIGIDNETLGNVMKNFKQKEDTGITSGKKKFDAVFEFISKKMASIKRHFFGSVFEIALETAKHNHENKDSKMIPNISFHTKFDSKEKIWIAFESIYPLES